MVSVTRNGYNICFTLAMYDFIDRAKDDSMLDVTFSKEWNNHVSMIIDTCDVVMLLHYTVHFVIDWNIGIGKNVNKSADFIPNEQWYECP